MDLNRMDKIHLRDLTLDTVIGVYPEERNIRQQIVLNITLFGDQRAAAENDDVNLAVDYAMAEELIIALVEASSYELIEALAAAVADLCLGLKGVAACIICLDKPGAPSRARSAAVEIFRECSPAGS